MKKPILFYGYTVIFLLQLFFHTSVGAQVTIEKVVDNGADSSKFVWVLLSEGYTQDQKQKFFDDTLEVIETFFSASPWREYQASINVYTIFFPSKQAGADHPSQGVYVDTAFDSTYDTYGITRLLTVNDAKVFDTASKVPSFDAVFVLVNDEQYGGSGGATIVFSTHESAGEIALHEAGHLIGKLADEYEAPYPGYPEGDREPNVTFQSEITQIPWKNWIDPDIPLPTPESITERVGLFEGARYCSSGIYRPKHNCRMRSLGTPYCEICTEALILSIYRIVDPIEQFGPPKTDLTLTDEGITFWVEPATHNEMNSYAVWEIDGNIVEGNNTLSLSCTPSDFTKGSHTVRIWLSNITSSVKTDEEGLLTSQHSWTLHKNFCSGWLSGTISDRKTGNPLSHASLTIMENSEKTFSDEQGHFLFQNIPCGSYTLSIAMISFKSTRKEISILDGHETRVAIALEPNLEHCYIAGSVSGEIAEGVAVALSAPANTTSLVETDKDGHFTFGPLPEGTYTVTASKTGYHFSPPSQTVHLTEVETAEITFFSQKDPSLFSIQGTIEGGIKEGITIHLSGQQEAMVTVDSQGKFLFEGLGRGSYVITPRKKACAFKPRQVTIDLTDQDIDNVTFRCKKSILYARFPGN